MDARKQKSGTIKSNHSGFEDFNTPPESPSLNTEMETSRHSTEYGMDSKGREHENQSQPPIPPPRTRRGLATKSAKSKLKEMHIAAESLEVVANELVNMGESLEVPSLSAPHNGNEIERQFF